jgi:hypothetical protein
VRRDVRFEEDRAFRISLELRDRVEEFLLPPYTHLGYRGRNIQST